MNIAKELRIGEMRPADTADVLAMRNSIFGEISRGHWDAMGCTAVLARRREGRRGAGKLMGAIPLQFRTLVLRPGASIPVVFENAVGVAEGARGRGIGTAMIEEAARFIRDRADALFVIRGGERSDGYRFYRKTHHGDLLFLDTLTLPKPRGADNDVEVLLWDECAALEKQLLPIFRSCYGRYGDYWHREKGYFAQIVASHVYRNDDCRLLIARARGGRIQGYAVTDPPSPLTGGCYIYDLAAPTPGALDKLLAKIAYLARRAGAPVNVGCNAEGPLYAPLLKRGFRITAHTPWVMARILNADRIFARLAGRSAVLGSLRLEAATPHRDLVLNAPKRPAVTATIYLKESQLSRLLSCRLDFAGALRTNLIRMTPVPAPVERALARAFRFSPWVVSGMDYV